MIFINLFILINFNRVIALSPPSHLQQKLFNASEIISQKSREVDLTSLLSLHRVKNFQLNNLEDFFQQTLEAYQNNKNYITYEQQNFSFQILKRPSPPTTNNDSPENNIKPKENTLVIRIGDVVLHRYPKEEKTRDIQKSINQVSKMSHPFLTAPLSYIEDETYIYTVSPHIKGKNALGTHTSHL